MSLTVYYRKSDIRDTDELVCFSPCCNEEKELTISELDELKKAGSVMVTCPECGFDFYIEINDAWVNRYHTEHKYQIED